MNVCALGCSPFYLFHNIKCNHFESSLFYLEGRFFSTRNYNIYTCLKRECVYVCEHVKRIQTMDVGKWD